MHQAARDMKMTSLSEKNRARWGCRRGMLELDFILQHFFDKYYDELSAEKKKLFSQLLKQDDPSLCDWLVGDVVCGDVALQEIIADIKKCH